MATKEPARLDARHCPRCGATGILPLDQPHDEHEAKMSPVMLCPVCDEEFRADGMTWLGAFPVANRGEMTDGEIEGFAEEMVDAFFPGQHEDSSVVDDVSLIDPDD